MVVTVAGFVHLVRQVGVRTDQGCRQLVECQTLWLIGFQLFGVAVLPRREVAVKGLVVPGRVNGRTTDRFSEATLDFDRSLGLHSANHSVGDGLIELVRMDVAAKDLDALSLVGLE